jgi:hypothetical protein
MTDKSVEELCGDFVVEHPDWLQPVPETRELLIRQIAEKTPLDVAVEYDVVYETEFNDEIKVHKESQLNWGTRLVGQGVLDSAKNLMTRTFTLHFQRFLIRNMNSDTHANGDYVAYVEETETPHGYATGYAVTTVNRYLADDGDGVVEYFLSLNEAVDSAVEFVEDSVKDSVRTKRYYAYLEEQS